MLLGMGLSLSNSLAAAQALFGRPGAFLRTPKFRVESSKDSWRGSGYALGLEPLFAGELFLVAYAAAGCILSAYYANWWSLPLLALYAGGYGLVATLGFTESLPTLPVQWQCGLSSLRSLTRMRFVPSRVRVQRK